MPKSMPQLLRIRCGLNKNIYFSQKNKMLLREGRELVRYYVFSGENFSREKACFQQNFSHSLDFLSFLAIFPLSSSTF